ncbi:MAG: hypothetical protein HFG67_01475 [Firmicutes bacterium]|nr:hypothetical protein [Bacillota bacterium]
MSKRKPRRSREFKKNNQIIDIEEARRERREKRTQAAKKAKAEKRGKQEQTASARKKSQKNRRRLIYAAIIFVIIAAIGMSAFKIISLLYEKSKLEKEHDRLLALKERLEQELESVNSPEYIEQQARSHLRLIKPGEILYILPDNGETENGGDTKTDENSGSEKE